jgi:hypothetical protein
MGEALTARLRLGHNRATHKRRRQAEPDRHRAARQSADGTEAEPPAAALALALQRAGNQAAGRMLARRPLAPPGPVGEVTAGVSSHDFITHNEAKAERELTLGSDGTGAFEGYESSEQAAIAASSSPKIGVVVADLDERFHAYETDLDPAPVETYAQPYDLKAGRVVRWTRLRDPGDPAIYEEQMRYAGSLASSTVAPIRMLARPWFINTLVRDVGLRRTEIHDSSGGDSLPGKINFNVHLKDANAHAGIEGALTADRDSELPVPKLEVGPLAFGDPVALRGTLLHEYEHMRHAETAIEAVQLWRATTSDGDFLPWLERRHKAGKVDAIDFAVIKQQVEGKSNNTESLAYLAGFTATYHLRSLAEIPDDEAGDTKLFKPVVELADEWFHANHAVQEEVVERLRAYRDSTLDDEHRRRLQTWAAGRRDRFDATSVYRLFYGKLAD